MKTPSEELKEVVDELHKDYKDQPKSCNCNPENKLPSEMGNLVECDLTRKA